MLRKKTILSLPKIKAITAILIITITTFFLVKASLHNYQQIQDNISQISFVKLILSSVLFLSYLYLRALSWRFMALSLGASVSKKDSFSIWFFSEATRYIPGNIWSFISRAYLARQKLFSWNASVLISPIEIIMVLLATLLLSTYALINILEKFTVSYLINSILVAIFIFYFGYFILKKRFNKLLNILFTQSFNVKYLLISLSIQILSWILYGLGTTVLISNFYEKSFILIFSSSVLSWLIGYLSIITPMGLGVRESAFVYLTGQYIGVSHAIFIAILHRLVLIITELVNLIMLMILRRLKIF